MAKCYRLSVCILLSVLKKQNIICLYMHLSCSDTDIFNTGDHKARSFNVIENDTIRKLWHGFSIHIP